MFSFNDFPNRFSMIQHSSLKGIARSCILKLQRDFKLFPREICLISGPPRSGTTALCNWLNDQRGISAHSESRILVSIHKFMEEIYKFQKLDRDRAMIAKLARNLVFDYYSSSRILIGKRLLIDKEPLEPIAFPSKDYEKFIINLRMLYPESKLLLVIRDPVATIWSMTRRSWGKSLANSEPKVFNLNDYIENWCTCVDIILQYQADPNTYIVQYGRLVNDSEAESRRIFNFLNIGNGKSFQSRKTKEIGFSNKERAKILQIVEPKLELLYAQEISELS